MVHRVVHGPGPRGWSMDLGPCFVYVQFEQNLSEALCSKRVGSNVHKFE